MMRPAMGVPNSAVGIFGNVRDGATTKHGRDESRSYPIVIPARGFSTFPPPIPTFPRKRRKGLVLVPHAAFRSSFPRTRESTRFVIPAQAGLRRHGCRSEHSRSEWPDGQAAGSPRVIHGRGSCSWLLPIALARRPHPSFPRRKHLFPTRPIHSP
jgi:hypothetical protein